MDTITVETKAIQDLFREKGWHFQIHGYGGLLTEPVEKYGWTYKPGSMDDTDLPLEAMNRAWTILNSGVMVSGFVFAHENKPQASKTPQIDHPILTKEYQTDWNEVIMWILIVLGIMTGIGFLVVGLFIFGMCTSSDPILIACLADDSQTWIEVYRWDEPQKLF